MENKIIRVRVNVLPKGKVSLHVHGIAENGKSFFMASGPLYPSEVSKKLTALVTEFDLSNYPFDAPGSAKALGEF